MQFKMPEIGETARAVGKASFRVGGKGVNASRTAQLWGAKSFAAIFHAGESGKRCLKSLSNEKFDGKKIEIIKVKIDGATREGLVCEDLKSGLETTFLGCDNPVCEKDLKKILAKIRAKAKRGDVLAFCGSFPGWKAKFAGEIFELCKEKKLLFCLDTYGAPLLDFLNIFKKHGEKIPLLKINKAEFLSLCENFKIEDLNGKNFESKFKIFAGLLNAENFAVSDGEKNSLFFCGGKFFKIKPPKVGQKSALYPTGCGDSMTALLACEILIAKTPSKIAAKIAVSFASKAAESRQIPGVSKKELLLIQKNAFLKK